MIRSMTGYASAQGHALGYRWSWDLRAVNGKGLDLRLRVPDWIEGLEAALRPLLSKAAARGNVTLSLRVFRDEEDSGLQLNSVQLDRTLEALAEVETRAMARGLTLTQPSSAELLMVRGVMDAGTDTATDTSALLKTLIAELPELIAAFNQMRVQEGAALHAVLSAQLQEISTLTDAAAGLLEDRKEEMSDALRRNLAKVLDGAADMDPSRIAQELAVLAVKSDVTEEIDRLRSHSAAALALLAETGSVGRKLDFLCQEFNREANTLCSKAQMAGLTEKGLALKVVIDQMREQVQNVE